MSQLHVQTTDMADESEKKGNGLTDDQVCTRHSHHLLSNRSSTNLFCYSSTTLKSCLQNCILLRMYQSVKHIQFLGLHAAACHHIQHQRDSQVMIDKVTLRSLFSVKKK